MCPDKDEGTLTIGKVVLPFPCVLAPLSGVSDLPFRLMSRYFGAPMAFTEMIDTRAIAHREKRTCAMLSSNPEDRPLGIQVLASEEGHLLRGLDVLQEYEYDVLDLNAACPTPKVTRKGKGAALLKEPKRLEGLLKALVKYSRVPVTVKIRAGWDQDTVNAGEIAGMAQDAGVCAVFIHGRTKVQGYSGRVDYEVIRKVKETLKIPVIASGDNLSVQSVLRMFRETNCDGVAVARGALGNPWIFKGLAAHFGKAPEYKKPDIEERIGVIKQHLDLTIAQYGEERGIGIFRKFFVWYTRGLKGAKPLRDRAFRTHTRADLTVIIDELRSLEILEGHE